MNNIFSKSENYREEYRCSIIRIGELMPIEGSDFLVKTLIDGESVVVRKDEVKEGDVMFYACHETELDPNFLALNNLFEFGEYQMNMNHDEVAELIEKGETDAAKRKVGFFNKYGRVKMIRLRGCPSFGFLFGKKDMVKRFPAVEDLNIEDYVGTDFDTVGDVLFIKAYVPRNNKRRGNNNHRSGSGPKKKHQFERMIDGEFQFHYDTTPLGKHMTCINPTDKVAISVKIHGTSAIFGNIKVKQPKWGGLYAKIFDYLPNFLKFTKVGYDTIYSSRKVIKNKYINQKVNGGFYGQDVWYKYAQLLDGKIPEGYTVYGEIFGYLDGDSKMIQKDYDYHCKQGANKLMIYRVSYVDEEGKRHEMNVDEVLQFTLDLISKNNALADLIHPIDILYHGTLMDLYPDVSVVNHWHEEVLERLKVEKRFDMENNEPLCVNKVPREGICLRIDDDPVNECFKLKTVAFRAYEAKEIDNGNVDSEMDEAYA